MEDISVELSTITSSEATEQAKEAPPLLSESILPVEQVPAEGTVVHKVSEEEPAAEAERESSTTTSSKLEAPEEPVDGTENVKTNLEEDAPSSSLEQDHLKEKPLPAIETSADEAPEGPVEPERIASPATAKTMSPPLPEKDSPIDRASALGLPSPVRSPSFELDESISAFASMINFDASPSRDLETAPVPPQKDTDGDSPLDQETKSPASPSANMSPKASRSNKAPSPTSTPSRKGIDVPRGMPSPVTPLPRSQSNQSLRSPISPGVQSPAASEGVRSPVMKLFGIGRRKGGASSSSGGKGAKDDEKSDSGEENTASSPRSAKGQHNQDRDQKTLSMILKEADEAMLDSEGEGDGVGSHDRRHSGEAFHLELDDLDEDDGLGAATG
jgi:hypothetical protein